MALTLLPPTIGFYGTTKPSVNSVMFQIGDLTLYYGCGKLIGFHTPEMGIVICENTYNWRRQHRGLEKIIQSLEIANGLATSRWFNNHRLDERTFQRRLLEVINSYNLFTTIAE